jgi:hypothetical protein
MRQLLNVARAALAAVSETFAPKPDATSRQVRINGALCIVVAFVCLGATFGLLLMFGEIVPPAVLAVPALFVYASLIVGGYRLFFGVSAKADDGPLMSFARIAFGIAWIVLLFGSLIGASILFG